jgi:hypothetical protein
LFAVLTELPAQAHAAGATIEHTAGAIEYTEANSM